MKQHLLAHIAWDDYFISGFMVQKIYIVYNFFFFFLVLNLPCVFYSFNENRKVMDFGFPRSIINDFPGVNSTINAAFYKSGEYLLTKALMLGENATECNICYYRSLCMLGHFYVNECIYFFLLEAALEC